MHLRNRITASALTLGLGWSTALLSGGVSATDFSGPNNQDGGLAGSIEGSFDTNYAVVLGTQITKRF